MRGAPTPNLDRLAAEGMRFVNYYGQASCTAGRASFITGRIPIRTSLSAVLAPGDPNGLTKETPTIAQYLKQSGYNWVQFGKWHVDDKLENFPTSNGFDEMRDMLPYYAGVYASTEQHRRVGTSNRRRADIRVRTMAGSVSTSHRSSLSSGTS
jgi:arylsulfatase A-like enzyme